MRADDDQIGLHLVRLFHDFEGWVALADDLHRLAIATT